MSSNPKKILIIPAAGIGSRMELDLPKQYFKLSNNKTILDNTISVLLEKQFFDLVIVSLSDEDKYWIKSEFATHPLIKTCIGGETRFHSVYNALSFIKDIANERDWIFVHDAARPCINIESVESLLNKVSTNVNSNSGILAIRAFETVKEVTNNKIIKTLNRENIWLAQTPQLSKFGDLLSAFNFCSNNNLINNVTDEASALELYGDNPIIVEGLKSNIKVTKQEDLEFVEFFLSKK
ncbi:2-C-methyl-D-erythritol 4-phosphate cytidylyltransferase [Pseudofrancisella aestuarii]|uniref:2-C-methyl-D-erythritol 4-phosphate cytidylyltransferase n=1 Tax=Pseudofrancisella aestuarii TaxID=2670347 RepID=A0ABV9T9Q3_9GAMM|nr:2-C-methyl-D-erythritol 4-phosphate cytidylyltransferase [Pseudofrancisella aestuarii]